MPHQVRILGSIEIACAGDAPGTVHNAHRPRRIALLAYLLLSRRPVRRQEIAALLWPDADAKRARGSLNQMMVEMRREFGTDSFERRNPDEIRITRGAFTCDAAEVIRIAEAGQHHEAIALYRGPLLDGFRIDGLDAFNDWADATRRRIDDLVADSAARAAAGARDHQHALASLSLAARLRPYDEAILRARMTATARMSGPAAATALFEEHRRRIADELSLHPAAETRRLLFEVCAESVEPPGSVEEPAPAFEVHAPAFDPHAPVIEAPAAVARPVLSRRFERFRIAAAIAACILLVAITLVTGSRGRAGAGARRAEVSVALMNFGDQADPAIRALPGLVATYLIRDTSIELSYGNTDTSSYQVVADLHADGDEMSGTLQVRSGRNVIASTAVQTTTRAGMDTIAAQLARYVTDVVRPLEHYRKPSDAVNAARQHLLFARADFARGITQNALFELDRATQQLDTVAHSARDAEWSSVSEAIVRERNLQGSE